MWLDKLPFHVHWFDKTVFPPVTDKWIYYCPYRECRCGARKDIGVSYRWFVNSNGEWEYDDGIYE